MSEEELPAGWQWATIDGLVTSKAAVVDGPFGSNLKTAHYTETGPRVVRLQNIGDGRFVDEEAHISEDHFERLRKHEVKADDVLVASLGEVLPRACVTPGSLGDAIVKADCIRIRPAPEISPRYVAFILNSPQVRSSVAAQIQGVGRPRINLSAIRSIRVPVPPSNEQLRIVSELESRLSHVDTAVARLGSTLLGIATLRVSLLHAAIRGCLVEQRADEEGVSSIFKELGIKCIDSTVVPAGWCVARLDSILTKSIGGVWGRPSGDDEVNVRVLRVTEMGPDGFLDHRTAAFRSVSKRAFASRELIRGDLIVEKSGGGPARPVGRVGMIRSAVEPTICTNFMQLVRVDRRVCLPSYLEAALRYFHLSGGTAALQTATTNIRNLKMKEYLSSPVPVPPLAEQQRIVDEVERRLSLLDAAEQTIRSNLTKAELLRRSLLAAAFRGELVAQDPSDEPAEDLLARIRAERAGVAPGKPQTHKGTTKQKQESAE